MRTFAGVPRPALVVSTAAALLLTGGGLALTSVQASAATTPYLDPSLPVATRVADLLSRMSVEDKVGQMIQGERVDAGPDKVTTYKLGSILSGGGSAPTDNTASGWADMYDAYQKAALATPLKIPVIYGVDAVHGHNNLKNATMFPHNIGLGATRNPQLVQQIGRATAEEVAATGVDWTFAPCLCVARNDRWGRTYESFGEDPAIATSMTSIIDGFQGTSLNDPTSILATAKHYVADGGTEGGDDQGDAKISEAELRAVHLPPFKAAVQRGVGSVMVSFSSWNGTKMHGNKYLITDVLKGELGFKGFVVTDWAAIDQLDGMKGFTVEEIAQAFNAGVDMAMAPENVVNFWTQLKWNVDNGKIPMSRVDDAVSRILTQKFALGLFERPYADRSLASKVGSAAHKALAREAVRQSQVLLKNSGGVLPLKRGGKIFVAGKNADDIGNQAGGWTITWQGRSGATTAGTTILQGIKDVAGSGTTVTYSRDGSGIDSSYGVAVAVVGETPYAEGEGDRPTTMGLDSTDLATLAKLKSAGVPVVTVLVSGRPLDIAAQLPDMNALVASWLPGTEGAGVADVLFGDSPFTGVLPVTWPTSVSQEPINVGDGKKGLFDFGFGLATDGSVITPSPSPTPTTTTTTTKTSTTKTRTTKTKSSKCKSKKCSTKKPTTTIKTSACVASNVELTGTGDTWATFRAPGSTCIPQAIFQFSVYASKKDAANQKNAVWSGQVTRSSPTVQVTGLKPKSKYWWRTSPNAPVAGPLTTKIRVDAVPAAALGEGVACAASLQVVDRWAGGYRAALTVTAGRSGAPSWSVSWLPGTGTSVLQAGGAALPSGGTAVVGGSRLRAGASTTLTVTGSATGELVQPVLGCTAG
ncbi:MAG: glycoside hydrolase family 3 N-terminal domain-containing protein [Kineosporiaceae bacterium]